MSIIIYTLAFLLAVQIAACLFMGYIALLYGYPIMLGVEEALVWNIVKNLLKKEEDKQETPSDNTTREVDEYDNVGDIFNL
jgi:hypothetical protein